MEGLSLSPNLGCCTQLLEFSAIKLFERSKSSEYEPGRNRHHRIVQEFSSVQIRRLDPFEHRSRPPRSIALLPMSKNQYVKIQFVAEKTFLECETLELLADELELCVYKFSIFRSSKILRLNCILREWPLLQFTTVCRSFD